MKIKFRIWDKRNNRMMMPKDFATIRPVIDFNGNLGIMDTYKHWHWHGIVPEDEYELMLFTGSHDKNEKEIFELDVVLYDRNIHKDIDTAKFKVIWAKDRYVLQEIKHKYYIDDVTWELVEVIGNIYENPELLKEEEGDCMKNTCRCKEAKVIKYKRENKELPTLHRDNPLNAGFDLFANIPASLNIAPGEVVKISLNVATEIPEDMVALVFQRSSTYRKWGLKLTNNVGVIDSLYRGDTDIWGAEFKNETNEFVTLNPGDKVCQAVFLELPKIVLEEVNHLGNEDRGGFGTSFDNAKELK